VGSTLSGLVCAPTASPRSEGSYLLPSHGDVSIPCPARLAATQPEAELELLEEHEIGSGLLREVEGLAHARRAEDVEAGVAQLAAEILARFRLELCDEDCALHATDASGASRSTPDVLCGGTVTTAPHPSERVSAGRNLVRQRCAA